MNIIIVGAGEIGRHLATQLSGEAHSISVIDSDPRLVADFERGIDAKVICDDGSSVHALAQANIGECDLFLALTSENTVNLMSASMAKAMGGGDSNTNYMWEDRRANNAHGQAPVNASAALRANRR